MSPAKSTLSKTQIDRLGDRLRRGRVEDDDLHLLDAYKQSFAGAYAEVVRRIRDTLGLKPTGRPEKSRMSIVQKLRRESIRLSQMQDIAGCRIIVEGIREQEETLQRVKDLFEDFTIIDRRERPSHGYRAVHVVVKSDDRLVEIQLRTVLQDFWAEFCERMADFDPTIKYGGGDESDRWILGATSEEVAEIESRERDLLDLERRYARAPTGARQIRIESARSSLEEQRQLLVEIIWDNFPKLRGNDDLPH